MALNRRTDGTSVASSTIPHFGVGDGFSISADLLITLDQAEAKPN